MNCFIMSHHTFVYTELKDNKSELNHDFHFKSQVTLDLKVLARVIEEYSRKILPIIL